LKSIGFGIYYTKFQNSSSSGSSSNYSLYFDRKSLKANSKEEVRGRNGLNIHPANILYVDPGQTIGGSEVSLIELMEGLDPNLYKPILLCPGPGLFPQMCLDKGIRVEYLPGIPILGGHPPDFARVLIPNTIAISRIIKSLDIQLVHSNGWRVAYYSGLAAHLSHIPAVTHIRDYHNSFRSGIKYWLLGRVSDCLIAVSHAVQESIFLSVPALVPKIRTIYDGSPAPKIFSPDQILSLRSEFGMADHFPLIAVVGAFSPLKGQAVILRSMPQILDNYPNARLLLVGESFSKNQEYYRDELIAFTHNFGMEDHVVFTGFRNDVQLIMASVDVLVHPPTLPDAFPHVLLEGGIQKALIVASNIGGISEIVQDGISGCLVPPSQSEGFARAINNLLDRPDISQKMREAIYLRVTQEFSMTRHVSEMQSLYSELIGDEI
jgi:glycosyltransferase involved in cell wall biosynthesis